MTSHKLAAGSAFPSIRLPLLNGGQRDLATPRHGFDWTLVIVYRGKHCPLCTRYLKELNAALPELHELGVDVVAASADSETRAAEHMADVSPNFDVAYGLTTEQMQALGLYISGPRNGVDVEAPFAEPGLFVMDGAGAVQIVDISNVPFARPDLNWIVKGIRFRRDAKRDAPVNGAYV